MREDQRRARRRRSASAVRAGSSRDGRSVAPGSRPVADTTNDTDGAGWATIPPRRRPRDRRGLRAVAIYVALNPVRAGFCADPRDWPYGAFRAYANLEKPRAHLTTGLVEDLFGSDGSLEQACDAALRIGRPGRPALATLLPPRRVVTREHVTQAIKVFGYTHAEIARHYRVTSRTLNRWLAVSRH